MSAKCIFANFRHLIVAADCKTSFLDGHLKNG